MPTNTFFGIDVSKSTLDFASVPDGKSGQVYNSKTGIDSLIKTIRKIKPELVVMEATGAYQFDLVERLHQANIPLHVANPRQIRDFARSLGRLSKTDALDALTIAQFAQSRKLEPQPPKRECLVQLSNLLKRREQLQEMLIIERNHLEHIAEALKPQVLQHMQMLKVLIGDMEKQIKQVIAAHSDLTAKDEIIQSLPGLGLISSATLLAELPELEDLGRKEAAALVGLAPFNRDSGKYRGQRHIFAGRARIRKVLYCALRPCLQFNPVVRKWFDHFLSKGKAYKVAAIACCRKLLIVVRSMLISNTYWQPDQHFIS